MSLADFAAKFSIAEAGKAGHSLAAAIMGLDLNTASQVDVDNLEATFLKYGQEVSHFEPDEERTHQAVTALEARLARAKAGAEIAGTQWKAAQAANNADLITSTTTQLNSVLATIEEIGGTEGDGSKSGTLFEARIDHKRAEDDLHQVQALHNTAADVLTKAKAERARKIAQVQRADRDVAREKDHLQHAREMSGLQAGMQSGSEALSMMDQHIAKAKETARGMQVNADALARASDASASGDSVVDKLLAGAPPSESPMDRLARLTGKA
jgi:hypothetical protein